MRVFQINAVPYGSTGKIMFRLADAVKQTGGEALCTVGFTWVKGKPGSCFITSNLIEKSVHMTMARLTGWIGLFSVGATRRLLKKLDAFRPDILHLHNLHGWFINLPMLFDYIKKNELPVVWTMHDCWSFTGHCPHFDGIGCEKWKQKCSDCPLYRAYPESRVDRASELYEKKKSWFTGVKNLTIVTPSNWLKEQVGCSFLRGYPVAVIHNGVDLRVFRPGGADVRKKFGLEGRHVILGVAYAWDEKKGLDVLIELADRLGDAYRIVLVGTEEALEPGLPGNVVPVRRTQDQTELAALYAAADVFVNPTREDTFPTVNMEALACGTPVVTFRTGGSPESIDGTCGVAVAKNDVPAMEREIRRICAEHPFPQEACRTRAEQFSVEGFDQTYMELYRSIYDRTTGERVGTADLC